MTFAILLLPLALAVDPAPKPRPVADAPAITKAARPEPAAWSEIPADPILTTLISPTPARWLLVDDGAELRPSADGKSAAFGATARGRYRVLVVPTEGDPIRVAVLVGDLPTPPPKPPGPVDPPQPPAPVVSELGKRLQVAFDADPAPKAERLKGLADKIELYRQAAVLAAASDVGTTGQLVARVKDASKALSPDGLAEVRKAAAAELAAAMPTDEPLTVESRAKAVAVFKRIQSALSEVK